MREVSRDDKWGEAQEKAEKLTEGALQDQLTELNEYASRQESSEADPFVEAVLLDSGPSDTELVIVALLMRLYDINLALLNHFDGAEADRIYEAHENGGHFNPSIFIPKVEETD